MAGLLTATAATWLLRMRIGQRDPEALVLKLFTNDRKPTRDDQASDYTEAIGQGYQAVTLWPKDWKVQPATGDLKAVATYPQVDFVFDGPLAEPVRGYFLVGADTGDLVGVEVFPEPRPIRFKGDTEQVNVSLVQP